MVWVTAAAAGLRTALRAVPHIPDAKRRHLWLSVIRWLFFKKYV